MVWAASFRVAGAAAAGMVCRMLPAGGPSLSPCPCEQRMRVPSPSKTSPAAGSLRVVPVQSRADRAAFLRLPRSLYQDDPHWVEPLHLEQRQWFAADNPFYEHAEARFWLALRDGRPVGRISAQVDRLHLERHRDSAGFFGLLEAEDQDETVRALLATAEDWLRERGMAHVRGPFNLSVNQECGLLVDGFDRPPMLMMGHARPYYAARLEACGYHKERDLLAYLIDSDVEATPVRRMAVARTRRRITTRTVSRKNFQEDLDLIFTLFNDAWADNWGFVPMTRSEITHMAGGMKFLINERFARIAMVDGEPAAFIVVLANLNEAITGLHGRLFPFGWLQLLWRLKVRHPRSGRMLLMGVRKAYQESLLGAALAYRLIGDIQPDVVASGMREVELSWVLEDNQGVRSIIGEFGGRAYKRYRIYGRAL